MYFYYYYYYYYYYNIISLTLYLFVQIYSYFLLMSEVSPPYSSQWKVKIYIYNTLGSIWPLGSSALYVPMSNDE